MILYFLFSIDRLHGMLVTLWVCYCLQCLTQSVGCTIMDMLFFAVVTLYATLGEDAILYGLQETDVNVVITSQELLPKLQVRTALTLTKVYFCN